MEANPGLDVTYKEEVPSFFHVNSLMQDFFRLKNKLNYSHVTNERVFLDLIPDVKNCKFRRIKLPLGS